MKSRGQGKGLIRRLSQGLLPLALGLLGGSAVGQPAARLLAEPDPLDPLPLKALQSLPGGKEGSGAKLQGGQRVGREIRYNLGIDEVVGKIYNPSTDTDDWVELRTYVELDENLRKVAHESPRFIAPLIYMKPGQTVRITLKNDLAPEKDCTNHENKPNCFNSTNLHTHGLWVSPAGNSDNVLLNIEPMTRFQYEYNVPEDHPAGTFWYHPHVHGSTAVQVGSGMAGALIIEGDRLPIVTSDLQVDTTGDIDTLLAPFAPKVVRGEIHDYAEVLLFQQIPYACFDKGNQIKTANPGDKQNPGRWVCGEKDIGKVENFKQQLGFTKWAASGRYTSINGDVQPTIAMQAGRVYRWRLIDAGVHEPIGLTITRLRTDAQLPKKPTPLQEEEYLKEHCEKGQVVNQFEIATDGLTRGQIVKRATNLLQPGYRSDVLFAFPSEGTYCLYDAATRTTPVPGVSPQGPKLLGWVSVTAGPGKPLPKGKPFFAGPVEEEKFIKEALKAAARTQFARYSLVKDKVLKDLDDGLKTTAFVPHKFFSDDELAALDKKEIQKVELFTDGKVFQVNKRSFNSADEPRTLLLGTEQKWSLTTAAENAGDHPFHIHVNPFQIVKVTDKAGNEIDYEKFPEYAGMKNTWKDTILIKHGYEVTVATRYERYIGDFVLHCHLLDHEDMGMMQLVRIVPTDSNGQPMPTGHTGHMKHSSQTAP
jgi:FtsP/CotA-like multicopper oxidase with cupredoxin domain